MSDKCTDVADEDLQMKFGIATFIDINRKNLNVSLMRMDGVRYTTYGLWLYHERILILKRPSVTPVPVPEHQINVTERG